jgi:hypothetical protein
MINRGMGARTVVIESISTFTIGRASAPQASIFMAVTMSSDIEATTTSGL